MSAAPVVFLQRFKIGPGLRRGIPKGFHAFFAAAVCDPVVKTVRDVFPGVGFDVIPQPGVLRLCKIYLLVEAEVPAIL